MLQRRTFLAAAGALAAAPFVQAQSGAYPSHAIRWLVGYPPGGGSDFVARTISAALTPGLGQTVIVENRPGANTIVAATALRSSTPDGYTVLSADLGTLVYNSLLYKKLSYDPIEDFAHISFTNLYQFVLICNPAFAAQNVDDVIAKAKAGKLFYASPGVGSTHHLTMELFAQQAGIQLEHTPYKGSAPALQDVMAGVVPLMVVDVATGLSAIKAGKARALAMASSKRSTLLPDVPTFEQAGVKGVDTNSWSVLVAPKGTPAAVTDRLGKELRTVLAQSETQQKLLEFGVEALVGTPQEVVAAIKADTQRWSALAKRLNISLEV
ncbi:MAG: tripartite tricarboxylate transporter substrate binding protein [Burkholderiaceae bacterium]|jgi:tripartite-type tricarboxylate transporter receptor subunit TctC|nr:tripartite tricarboxylate transporter substrate binding protein [Burkholderiaceae bacterium]